MKIDRAWNLHGKKLLKTLVRSIPKEKNRTLYIVRNYWQSILLKSENLFTQYSETHLCRVFQSRLSDPISFVASFWSRCNAKIAIFLMIFFAWEQQRALLIAFWKFESKGFEKTSWFQSILIAELYTIAKNVATGSIWDDNSFMKYSVSKSKWDRRRGEKGSYLQFNSGIEQGKNPLAKLFSEV